MTAETAATAIAPAIAPAIAIDDLVVRYSGRPRPAVDGVSLQVARGRTLGVLGESGCGKSSLAQAIVGLVRPTSGEIRVNGTPLAGRQRWWRTAASPVQIIFQDPQGSFNPRRRVWQLIAEPMAIAGHKRPAQRDRAAVLLEQVGLSVDHLDRYPHEFSGGQRQRMAIARALASEADILVLDEPTSALDVSVQAQVLNLLVALQRARAMTFVFISHNVAVIRHMSDDVAVMRGGRLVEIGPATEVLERPREDYTRALIAAVPKLMTETRHV